MGHKGFWRVSRVVILPDWQGVGVGKKFLNETAKYFARTRRVKISISTSLKGFIEGLARDINWKCTNYGRLGADKKKGRMLPGRINATFLLKNLN